MVFVVRIASIFLVISAAWGQTAELSGNVADSSHAAIPAASLTIHNEETRAERTTTTSSEGFYLFPLLPPGRYTVSVRAPGI